jgi:Tol biopolymer transport system component
MTSTRATRSPRRRGRPIWGVAAAVLTAGVIETGALQASPAGAAVAAETGTTVQVSTVSSAAELPAINGDGRYVVFVGRSKANWGVYLHDQLTGATERLTTGNDMNPAISQMPGSTDVFVG